MQSDIPPQDFTHSNHPALMYEEMLADEQRMIRYRQAIEQAVKPGDVVADLGTGTGVLAMMAIQAGASHVYAVDYRPYLIPVAQQILDDNGMQNNITLVCGDAREVDLGVKVDLIINELLGDFGTDENIVECVQNFADRHLKEGGRVMPEKLTTFLVPVSYGDEYRGIWRKGFHDLDMSAVANMPCREEAQMLILRHPVNFLAEPVAVETIDFNRPSGARVHQHDVRFELRTSGIFQGFMGYFVSELTSNITIDNYPGYPGCHWQTWHWPVYPQKSLQQGQTLSACLKTPENMVAQGWSLNWQLD